MVAQGTPAELKEKYSYDRLKIVTNHEEAFEKQLLALKRSYQKVADQYIIELKDTQDALDTIDALKPYIHQFEVIKGSMDDVFIQVVGEQNYV